MNKMLWIKNCTLVFSIAFMLTANGNSTIFAQNTQEAEANKYLISSGVVFFKFAATRDEINSLTKCVSIDNVKGDTVYAYANRKELTNFLKLNLPYTVLPSPSLPDHIKMASTAAEMKAWDSYPSYTAYLDLMNNFVSNFPNLCSLHEIGTTTNGHKLLFIKISDHPNLKEAEPEFMFSSSIHGDELTGCINSLRLIDFLLNNYETDSYVKRLVDSIEIWINPLANPDGTYHGGNSSVSGATRYNANFIDLNRNFPDPNDGPHPDGEIWQEENVAMMNFFGEHNFVFSANYHGGAEVLNYPWDNFSRRHPDVNWFQYVSRNYADTVKQYGGSDYFSDVISEGYIDGYDWYPIAGGRQDYMTYFCHGREITIEVSETKKPLTGDLESYWNYNYKAMLQYIENCLYGIRGIVTDSATHSPLRAKLEVISHDADSSQIYSEINNGNYHRMIGPGNYDLKFSASGYKDKVIPEVSVSNFKSQVWLDVALAEDVSHPIGMNDEPGISDINFYINSDMLLQAVLPVNGMLDIEIYDINGKLLYHSSSYHAAGKSVLQLPEEKLSNGINFCRIGFLDTIRTIKISNYNH
jgi:hypothetical protein